MQKSRTYSMPDDLDVLGITMFDDVVVVATDKGVYALEETGLERLCAHGTEQVHNVYNQPST